MRGIDLTEKLMSLTWRRIGRTFQELKNSYKSKRWSINKKNILELIENSWHCRLRKICSIHLSAAVSKYWEH